VSLWPTQILRLTALVLNALFLAVVHHRLDTLARDLTTRFFPACAAPGDLTPGVFFRSAGKPAGWRRLLERIFAGLSTSPAREGAPAAEALWREYLFQGSPVARWVRVVVAAGLFFGLGFLLIQFVFPAPLRLARSAIIHQTTPYLLAFTVFLFLLLVFSVADAIRLCDKFTRELARPAATTWPTSTSDRFREELGLCGGDREAVAGWIDVRLVAQWTAAIGPLVYYPFVTLGLVLLARSPLLANWDLPLGLYVVFGITAGYTAAAAYTLRRAAERTRRLALDDLGRQIMRATGRSGQDAFVRQLVLLRDEAGAMREGALAPFAQQPILRAFLLPLISGGGLALIEYLIKA
jgi:hypothetical protein